MENLQGFEGLSALEESAVRLHEIYKSLLTGGFTEDEALSLIAKMTKQTQNDLRYEIKKKLCLKINEQGRYCPMSQISIIGDEGKPVLYASLTDEGKLFFEFELYGRNENEGDYEFNHTVEPEEFPKIAARFGLNPNAPILSIVQEITDLGRGQELERALTSNEIKNELWTWLSTPWND
jgi:hypothetical protein